MPAKIAIDRDAVADFCRRHHIRRLALFGSVLRSDFEPESDVDVLVEFEPGYAVGFIRLARMERELSRLLGGCKVDIRTPADLSRYFRDAVLAEAEVFYDAARSAGSPASHA
ncbi:MAG TPA: nucleotidyltransferase family protein [Phycisphaerae bacterium]|nr:nucleotidyltransferase family protein [Phycisphaerae bacterium]